MADHILDNYYTNYLQKNYIIPHALPYSRSLHTLRIVLLQPVKDAHLMALVGAVMIIDVILLVAWQIPDPLVVQLFNIDREVDTQGELVRQYIHFFFRGPIRTDDHNTCYTSHSLSTSIVRFLESRVILSIFSPIHFVMLLV